MSLRWQRSAISSEETAQLAARVAELTKAGLPLGPGLLALADELPGRRLPNVLRTLAERLEAGEDLLVALESHAGSLPPHLRGMMLAGIQSGQLSEVLEEFVELERSRLELGRRIWLSLAYPFVLLLTLTALAIVANVFVVAQFAKMFREMQISLPQLTLVVINGAGPVMWLAIAAVAFSLLLPLLLWLMPGVRWILPVLYRVPMLGPLVRYGHLKQFSRLMDLLLQHRVPLPEALRLTAAGLRDAQLASGCRAVAQDVENGRVLYESMAARPQFPPSLIPVVEWGQRAPALPDAFCAAAEMFEGRLRSQGSLLEIVLLPIMLLTIIVSVGFFVIALFLPLITMVERLAV